MELNHSIPNDYVNNTHIDSKENSEDYWILFIILGPIAVILCISICVHIYSNIIKKYVKCHTDNKIIVESIVNPIYLDETNCSV